MVNYGQSNAQWTAGGATVLAVRVDHRLKRLALQLELPFGIGVKRVGKELNAKDGQEHDADNEKPSVAAHGVSSSSSGGKLLCFAQQNETLNPQDMLV